MKHNYLIFILILFSCNPLRSDLQITFYPVDFNVESIGISSDLPFPFHCEKDKLIVYNSFRREFHELDLITKNSKLLLDLDNDERVGSSELISFIFSEGDYVLFESKSITIIKDGEIEKILFKNLSIIGNDTINIDDYNVAINAQFGNFLLNTDFNTSSIFFNIEENKNTINSFLVEFNFKNPTELKIKETINTPQTKIQKIFLQKDGMYLTNQTSPFISSIKNKLLISYTFQSNFYLGSSKNHELNLISLKSEKYGNEKISQKLEKEDLTDFLSKLKAWNSDISYGPILPIHGTEFYFRIVKGKSEEINPFDGVLYFECFDKDFNKISEEELNVVDKDLTTEYFSSSQGIFIKRTSENENLLKYYKLSVNIK